MQAMEVNKKIIQRHKKLQVTDTALNNKSSIEKVFYSTCMA